MVQIARPRVLPQYQTDDTCTQSPRSVYSTQSAAHTSQRTAFWRPLSLCHYHPITITSQIQLQISFVLTLQVRIFSLQGTALQRSIPSDIVSSNYWHLAALAATFTFRYILLPRNGGIFRTWCCSFHYHYCSSSFSVGLWCLETC